MRNGGVNRTMGEKVLEGTGQETSPGQGRKDRVQEF